MDKQPLQNQQHATPVREPGQAEGEEQEQQTSEPVKSTDRPHGPVMNLVIILLVVIIVGGGIGGYFLLKLSEHVYTVSNVNVTVRYNGLDITFNNIQQADSFDNDSVNSVGGVARINLSVHNPVTTAAPQAITYTNIIRLLSPSANIVSSNNTLVATFQPKAGETLTNWVDFAMPRSTDLSTYKILVGKTGEKPIIVPIQKPVS